MINTKSEILDKWIPITQGLGIVNKNLAEIISFFCEDYCVSNPDKDDLPGDLPAQLLTIMAEKQSKTVLNNNSGQPTGLTELEELIDNTIYSLFLLKYDNYIVD